MRHAIFVFRRRWLWASKKNFQVAGDLRDSFEIYLLKLQDRLWSGKFIRGSAGHFRQLWVRDLGLFSREYIENGYARRLEESWEYALTQFSRQGRVTTTIWPNGRVYNIFGDSSDGFPLMLWSLSHLSLSSLVERYRGFLKEESRKYRERCFDSKSGFTKLDLDLCGMKDAVCRKSSAYSFCMNFLFDRMQEYWGFGERMHSDEVWRQEYLRRYWNEEKSYFEEDISRSGIFSADAQLLPFWLELFPRAELWGHVWRKIRESALAHPVLIRQTEKRFPEQERFVSRLTAPNYQGDTVWANLGAIALCLGARAGEDLRQDIDLWADLCFRDGELMELYTKELTPYKSFFYKSDEGMNWSIGFLSALRLLRQSFPTDPPECD